MEKNCKYCGKKQKDYWFPMSILKKEKDFEGQPKHYQILRGLPKMCCFRFELLVWLKSIWWHRYNIKHCFFIKTKIKNLNNKLKNKLKKLLYWNLNRKKFIQ